MTADTKRWKEKTWRYYRSEDTNLERTFARVRRQMKEAEAAKKTPATNVKPLPKKGDKGAGRA